MGATYINVHNSDPTIMRYHVTNKGHQAMEKTYQELASRWEVGSHAKFTYRIGKDGRKYAVFVDKRGVVLEGPQIIWWLMSNARIELSSNVRKKNLWLQDAGALLPTNLTPGRILDDMRPSARTVYQHIAVSYYYNEAGLSLPAALQRGSLMGSMLVHLMAYEGGITKKDHRKLWVSLDGSYYHDIQKRNAQKEASEPLVGILNISTNHFRGVAVSKLLPN